MTAGRAVVGLSRDWGTPEKYVAAVRHVFGGEIDLDPCSNRFSIVRAKVEYRLPTDGLKASWDFAKIFVNPPYGFDRERHTSDWLARCVGAHQNGSDVIALVPVATNTWHWKNNVWGVATSVVFLYDTRLKFLVDGAPNNKGAPMACAMVYWGSKPNHFKQVFSVHGAVVDVCDVRRTKPILAIMEKKK
jgi:DNA N-6-adenine-methyltransferase (Dam)